MHVHLILLLFFLSLSVAPKTQWQHHHDTGGLSMDVSCLNKYGSLGRHVECTWRPHNQSLGQGPFYLQFSDRLGLFSSLICELFPSREVGGLYSCIAEGDGEFTEYDEYRVSLHAASSFSLGETVFALYEPRLHKSLLAPSGHTGAQLPLPLPVQCDAPNSLQSHANATKCRIQWDKAEDGEDFIVEWQWQLEFKHDDESWEQAKQKEFVTQESWVDIDSSELKCGEKYVARIRRKVPDGNTDYRGPWSPWSTSTHCTALPGCGQKQSDPRFLWTWPVSLPFGLGGLLFLLLSLKFLWRLKDRERAHTPTPATFFQPLYASHNGDFKGWAGLKGRAVFLSSNTEEDSFCSSDSSSHRDNGQVMEGLGSQISFLTPLFKIPQDKGCPPNSGNSTGIHSGGSKIANLREECTDPLSLLLPRLSRAPGTLADAEGKGAPLSSPSFQELGLRWETENLFSCSNDYYCIWEGGSGNGPGAPCGAEGCFQLGTAPGQG
nr:PREDICTED: interleukin-9 receptor-like [Anolis carolinensis]|eukprot:XP_016853349.1 PREDICTED: interleukin-9 receptor-like [Anolis carolinensis]